MSINYSINKTCLRVIKIGMNSVPINYKKIKNIKKTVYKDNFLNKVNS